MLKNVGNDEIAEYAKPFSRPFPLALLEILLREKYCTVLHNYLENRYLFLLLSI